MWLGVINEAVMGVINRHCSSKDATLMQLMHCCFSWPSNCPGLTRTVLKLLTWSYVQDAPTICPGSVGQAKVMLIFHASIQWHECCYGSSFSEDLLKK